MRYSRWDDRSSTGETNEFLFTLASAHLQRCSESPIRERFAACIASRDVHSLCDLTLAYEELTAYDAIQFRQILAFFTKRGDLDLGFDRRATALEAFVAAERLCMQTNDVFRSRLAGKFSFLPGVESKLFRAQRKIATILGDVPNLCDLRLAFGPGATTNVTKRIASSRRKLSTALACSEEFSLGISAKLEELQGLFFDSCEADSEQDSVTVDVEIHPGRLAFVPKNYKTFRGIGVEPVLNTLFQNGIGRYMSRRLLSFGVDLKDQSHNQRLALEGSLTGALATLDLSSASDTVALELVFDLLPLDWALFLSEYRTGTMIVEGLPLRLEKFCSMGNGFTFPLESLIFYALACACVPEEDAHQISVYGDDIIVPTHAYSELVSLLEVCGFSVNLSKSFSSGPFRESCGADYLRGISIRPSYIKDVLSCFDLFRLHNQYVRRGDFEMAALVAVTIPTHLKRWGPDGYGDGHLIGDNPLRPFGRDKGWCGYTFETYTFSPKFDFSVLPGDRVYPSYSIYVKEDHREVSPITRSKRAEIELLERINPLSGALRYLKDGRFGVSIPGRGTYRSIRIYVLSS